VTSRRRFVVSSTAAALALPALAGCGTPLPLSRGPQADDAAARRLQESAEAHGVAAYRALTDINIAYDGRWRPFIDRIQPEVVDAGFRGSSEERLMPRLAINAQAYRGPRGTKQVWWRRGEGTPERPGEVAVWFNGQPSRDRGPLTAAALVAEGYGLFLLGPLWLSGRGFVAELDGTARVHGRLCDVVNVWMRPGLGQVALDRVAVFVDRDDAVTRRVRFTLEGYEGTRGAVAEVDTFEHRRLFGVLWPMRSYEEVVHPLRVPAHDWTVTGLDVNRGYAPEVLAGAAFTGAAAAPARPL
jgi:predicted small lipoprotein YifL